MNLIEPYTLGVLHLLMKGPMVKSGLYTSAAERKVLEDLMSAGDVMTERHLIFITDQGIRDYNLWRGEADRVGDTRYQAKVAHITLNNE